MLVHRALRQPKATGDKGVIMCFRERDGQFRWQMTHDKLPAGRVNDWPQQGICSTPAVDGDRFYYVSNRCELVCADLEGFLDGENDGPFNDETLTSTQYPVLSTHPKHSSTNANCGHDGAGVILRKCGASMQPLTATWPRAGPRM